jgi:hypothetical protein
MYLGLVPLSLLPLGLVGSLRRKEGIFLGLLGGLSLLVAFGTYTAAFSLAYRFLPGLAYFRVPARFLFLFCFAAAALGAIGLDHLMRAGPSRRIWFQVGLAALWVLFGIWGFHALNRPELVERVASLGYGDSDVIRGVQLLQLCRSVSGVREYYGRLYLETLTLGGLGVVAIFVLSRRPKLGRILVVAVLCLDVLGFSRGRAPWALAGAGSEYLQASNWLQQVQELRNDAQYRSHLPKPILAPNLGMLHDLPVGDGYCSFLPQARHTALMTARDEQDPTFAHRLAELFAVGYELEKPAKPNQEDAPLVRRNNVPPRARLAVHAEQASTATQALERTLAGDFDPWQEVVVEQYSSSRRESDERKLDTLAGANDGGSAQSSEQRVRWVVDEPERLRIELDTLQDAWLVVSDAHWPGWKAMVNGQEQQIYRANYYFRAVRVPAGHSTVEMRYADHSMWLGIPVTVLSAMGILVALGLSRNRSLGASNAPLTTPTRPSHARPSLW